MWWRDKRQYVIDRLAPCEPTRDDIDFLIKWLPKHSPRARDALLADYRGIWIEAMKRERVVHKKQNKGRFAANNWLRNARVNDYRL